MQNFSNSAASSSLPPGFSGRGGAGPPYPSQPAEPQISPRITDDYAGMQQQSLHRGHPHPGQASHMLAYSSRNRGAVELPAHSNMHSGNSNNPYRKDPMDYYFSMGGKDRNRRVGMGFGASFGYPNMDGQIPQQYRPAGSGSTPSVGLMSPYPVDYGSTAGTGGGAGAFSPSHQYNMAQNPAMQSVPSSQMQHRQHGQAFPSVHQQHRNYPQSGHRMTPQYPQYSPQGGGSTGSSGMYSPPPQRYLDGAAAAGFDPKVNSSPTVNAASNSVPGSVPANNVGPMENVQQSYHASNYAGYSPQTHVLHKQATLQQRSSQHNLGVGYDNSLKMQHQGSSSVAVFAKHQQPPNPNIPQTTSLELAKSPMPPNAQQPQINQNFSPISNPSPAASAVHSPSCSSSPSPLMGVSEAHGNPSGHGPSHPPISNPRSNHGHARLLQTIPQLSPTPNSNSSISSCGSSGSHKAHSMIAVGGSGIPPPTRNKMGLGAGIGREESYSSPHNKMQDTSLNSLNALSSQVANLPNTVQHMILTDTVLSQKRGKDEQLAASQPRSRNASATSSTSTVKDGGVGGEIGPDEEQFSEEEHGRVRQMSGASSGSEPSCNPPTSQSQQRAQQGDPQAKEAADPDSKVSSATGPKPHSPPSSNCIPEHESAYNENGVSIKKNVNIKKEIIKHTTDGAFEKREKLSVQNVDVRTPNGQDKENKLHSASRLQNNEREEKHTSEEQQSASSVGVIVSARSEASLNEKSKQMQEGTEEKQSHSRESSHSHNGEEGVDLSLHSSHQRSHFGQPQNPSQPGPQKYGYPESTYGSDLSMKNRGRTGLGGVIESNSKYTGYQQSQTSFVSTQPKESAAEQTVKRGRGPTAVQADNSQQFPSLLQEVLQGYNLDRRYGRPEVYPANLQHQLQNRHPYSLTEMQSEVANAQIIPEKAPHPKQRISNEADFAAETPIKLEAPSAKFSQKAEKVTVGVSQSALPQAAEAQQPPPKHINLADYSLPQRKALSQISTHSSAVQELLLQEPEPLTGSGGQSEAPKPPGSILAPSERRSVICDMSPNRRGTPERDRDSDRDREKSQSGASVIQQPFSSPAATSDLSKKDSADKQVAKVEAAPKEAGADAGNFPTLHHTDLYRRGNVDAAPIPPHAISASPLSSPSRHQSYLRGMDLSTGNASTFHGYPYGDMREGMPRNNLHFPAHHPFHNLPGQTQSANKLQMYPPHPRTPLHLHQDMNDWLKAMNRTPKDLMMQPGSSPGRQKISQSEQRQRMMSHTDMASDRSSMQSSYYDIKMWEVTHSGREGEPYYRTQPPPLAPPPPPVASQNPVPPQITPISIATEPSAPRGPSEETKHPCPIPMTSTAKLSGDMHSPPPQTQRQTKAAGSADTNPLMLRRRVRSFISPIPAKRQLQDTPQQRAASSNSHHSPGTHSETSHHNEDDSSSSEMSCPRLSSPLSRENTYSQALSPSNSNTKATPPRKGRGLKLEAIVQKITPNIKKPAAHTDDDSNHYTNFSHSNEIQPFNDAQDQDVTRFPRVSRGDDGYMDESHSLNDMSPFRRVDEAGPTYKPNSRQTSQTVKQKDFDFGIPASSSGDKEDFTLLGPLPPPPPLPRPVQGSPPPSSSALSDIQHFTNTYQQLETRRGEQSAANLLRQKLQESGMGFDDYPGSDYYGTTPPQGHMLSRQHQMSSARSSLSPQDLKPPENLVPKGYFPSGKKKGRPVGSVNKQKRAQNQGQAPSQAQAQPAAVPAPPALSTVSTPVSMAPQSAQSICSPESTAPPLLENKNSTPPPTAPPILTQVTKVDMESEDTQPEIEVKPVRRRRRGVKGGDEPFEATGKQRRRRRGAAAAPPSLPKDDPDVPLNAARGLTNRTCVDPNRKGLFVPHIHVENKIPEIGAVCSIVNAEEDKMKGERSAVGGKASSSGIDSLLTSALSSQLSRRDRESEKRETDEVETALQSGKALPSSGYVVSGPVITETNHSGRLLCCLCQKWANYKNLGDLYGPYYPAEYVAKLPKNQPQVKQCQTAAGASKTGPNSETSSSTHSSIPDLQTKDAPYTKPSNYSDYPISLDSYLSRTVQTAFPPSQEEMMHITERFSSTSPFLSSNTNKASRLSWDMNLDIIPIPELKRESDIESDQQKQADETQLRPQHRKLTSHPRFKRRHKSSEKNPRMVPSNSKASLPFQPPPPALDSLGPLAQLAQLPQMPMDPEELWVHEGCIVWTSGVYLVNGRLYGLQEALDGARETCCSYCDMVGSTLGCYTKGCTLRYHYLCAIETDCSLNEDNFSLRCPKHKVKKESLTRASGHSSLYSWSSQKEAERSREENDQFEYGNCWFGLQMCDDQ